MQKQEDEKLCNQETNKLEQLLVTNQQLVHRTDAETKRAKRLQVSTTASATRVVSGGGETCWCRSHDGRFSCFCSEELVKVLLFERRSSVGRRGGG